MWWSSFRERALKSRTLQQRQGCRGLRVQLCPLLRPSMTIVMMCLPLPRVRPPALHLLLPWCTLHFRFLSPTFRRSSPISSTPNPQHLHRLPRPSLIRPRALRYFTMELLQDPVFAADGFTCTPPPPAPLSSSPLCSHACPPPPPPSRYERSSMQQWLALGHNTSPKSGALLPNTALVPNHDLRARVQEWVQVGGGG